MRLVKRFFTAPKESFFLFGPRGTGKSTWLMTNFPQALLIDLLQPDVVRRYSAYPERLEETVLGSQQKQIIIDEIQHVPELLNVVHRLIEQKRGWQFILTGSSARKLRRTGVNLLAGRAIVRHLHPFMAAELGSNFDLTTALQSGLLPVVTQSEHSKEVLKTYISLYLKEEVQAESLVRNIGHFARFLEIASFSHASISNISNIARETQVSRPLVENYLSVLEDLLLSFTLPVFTKRAKRETIKHPKFYYFDAGVFQNLRKQGPLDRGEGISGLALEGLVAQHLRAWNDYQASNYDLYYWRTRFGVEVDFILYGPKGFWAIEVKNNHQVFSKDLTGLRAFCKDYPEATPLLLYRGKERFKKNNILCLPVNEFLLNLDPNQTLI
ncbi:ATP-binding protein [Coxiella burnetii]|uniref:ATP-binding protein n=2 Tax=Coxiella burnetii TaxID=777 RepID=UPI00051F1724|nr:AAA family ATPase [Coxiella burnetii]AIT62425.1 putative ATPase [Coxiella burnetii str. Namibia]